LLSDATNIVVSVSAFMVACVAIFGINQWRKELKGRTTFELARELMKLGYKVSRGLKWARFPMTTAGEIGARPVKENESQDEYMVLAERDARHRRLKPVAEDLAELEEKSWEAEIILEELTAKQVKEAIQIFRQRYADIITAIEEYFDVRYREVKYKSRFADQEWVNGLEKIFYSLGGDEASKDIDGAVTKMSVALRKYVK